MSGKKRYNKGIRIERQAQSLKKGERQKAQGVRQKKDRVPGSRCRVPGKNNKRYKVEGRRRKDRKKGTEIKGQGQ